MRFIDHKEHSPLAREGFTLVELLTVITLLALVSGLVSSAYLGVTQTARLARTRAIIAACDGVIQEKYEDFKYRPLPVVVPDLFMPTGSGAEVGRETLAVEAARVRLMMIRDLQRMEMPDRWSDIREATGGPARLMAAVSPVIINDSGQIVSQRAERDRRSMFSVNWFSTSDPDNIPSQLASYRDRLNNIEAISGGSVTAEHQGAECLYLIMSTSFVGGSPAIDGIPSSNIGDTDGDGALEILDGWGVPLGFVRWPVGYADPNGSIDRTTLDDFDLYRADYAYTDLEAEPTFASAAQVLGAAKPWSTRPLLVSAGSDGEFGITTNPWTATGEQQDFSYLSNWGWNVDVQHYGTERPGRGADNSNLTFPDPYLRTFVGNNQSGGTFSGLLPGQQLSNSTAADERADNITNLSLQADQ